MYLYYTLEIKYAFPDKRRIYYILLNGEFCAALDTTAFDHSAASLRGNTGTKTVRTCAVSCVWLVGSFWHICIIVPNLAGFYKL